MSALNKLKKAAKKNQTKVTQRAKTAPAPKKAAQKPAPRPAPHPMAPKPGKKEFDTPATAPKPAPAPQAPLSEMAIAATSLPTPVAQILVDAVEFFTDLSNREVVVECAPDAVEAIGAEGAQELESLLHEKKLTSFLMTRLSVRESELKDALKELFELTGIEAAAVHGIWAKTVESHSSRLDREILLKRGVKAADIEAATVKTPYTYIGIYDPRDAGPKGGSTFIHPEHGKGKA